MITKPYQPVCEPDGWKHLPHIDQPNLIQEITIRLHDSMPSHVRAEWREYLQLDPQDKYLWVQHYIDAGKGSCLLGSAAVATLVERCLLDGDGTRYSLLAWVVMPNHVHMLVRTTAGWSLSKVMQSLKGYSTKLINQVLNRSGQVWQGDYYDRFIRNQEHLQSTTRYIHNNPVMAGLATTPREWRFSSARFVNEVDETYHVPWTEE
ncbi:MAG: REP-associated tyrosine transposase [Anaerolineae bacterium]